MTKMEINGETYVKESQIKDKKFKSSKVQIVVLNRGWIIIGRVIEEKNKTFIVNASVIRNWGTTKGLGELAYNGSLNDTILDKCPDIEVDTLNIVLIMNCNEDNWKNV